MSYSVYHIMFPSGKAYIGVTSNLKRRLIQHRYNKKTPVGFAFSKYGSGEVTVLAICDEDYAYDLERRAIEVLNTLAPQGYNLMEGGMGGRRMSEETCLKMSQSHIGTTMSQESKDKLSASKKGIKRPSFSEMWRRNLSESKKGKTYTPSVEHRKAISEAKRGKKLGPMSDHQKHRISEAQKARWAQRRVMEASC